MLGLLLIGALAGAPGASGSHHANYGDCVSEGGVPPVVGFPFGPYNLTAGVASDARTQSTGRFASDGHSRFDNYGFCTD